MDPETIKQEPTIIPRYYIKDIKVVYGDLASQIPPDAIPELLNRSCDANDGFGGKYVWLVPVLGSSRDNALTKILVIIQKEQDSQLDSLAKGSSGEYRYIKPYRSHTERKITNVVLVRTSEALTMPPYGYDGYTSSINAGRGGPYLYLAWQLDF